MTKHLAICAILAAPFFLAGCSVSGVLDQGVSGGGNAVVASPVEPLAPASSDKFAQSGDQSLRVADGREGLAGDATSSSQAYIDGAGAEPNVALAQAELKPFVGRWSMNNPNARVRSGGLAQAEPDFCSVDLQAIPSDHGFRAIGSRACPTNLFMLDSWVPFDDRLVLRDHMGDEIVSLSGRGPGLWVGVHKDGTTFVLRRS